MDRTPGYGEITGRLDDLEQENRSLRNLLTVVLAITICLYLDVKLNKGGKDVD